MPRHAILEGHEMIASLWSPLERSGTWVGEHGVALSMLRAWQLQNLQLQL
jgi:hypothetical protein